jgi:hypothetical protein
MYCKKQRNLLTLLRLMASKKDFPAKSLSASCTTVLSSPCLNPAAIVPDAPNRLQLRSIVTSFLRFRRRRTQMDEIAPGPIPFPLSMSDSKLTFLQAWRHTAEQPSSPKAFNRRSSDLRVLFIVNDFASDRAPSFPTLLLLKFKCVREVVGEAITFARA